MRTLDEFAGENGITLDCERVDSNPGFVAPDHWQGNHYKVCLRRGRSRMTLLFSKGFACKPPEPHVAEVLSCLADDSAGIDCDESFEDWAQDLGYDADSRKAEKIFRACCRHAKSLKKFLGSDLYEELLWNVERD